MTLQDEEDDPQWYLFNNLFYGGTLYHNASGSSPVLRAYDNLFDKTKIVNSGASFTHDYNGYVTGQNRLTPNGTHDILISSPVYASGALGRWYLDNTAPTLLDADNVRTPALVGLYHYTVKTAANSKEGDDVIPKVDIGFHYAAVDGSGQPVDTDGDGLADYLEDKNGSGSYDSGDVGDFINADSDGDGLPDNYELASTLTSPTTPDTGNTGISDGYKDSDGDGLTNLEEMKLGKNPLVPNVASPIFSPVGGSYASAQNVVVTCPTAGATIRFTLNGNEPTEASQDISLLPQIATTTTLKAKAWKASWTTSDTESQSYSINGPANNAPTLTVSPASGGAFLASDSIEILVEAGDTDGTIARVQLFRGNYKVAETTTSPLRHTLANVPAGTYLFTAKAIDNLGAVTVSAPITITIAASGPVVSLVGGQPFFTSSPGTLLANITGVNPSALTTLTLNGSALVPRAGAFAINAVLVEGANTFTLVANGSASASTTVYLDSIAPVVAIASPANNATFSATRVNVSGTVTETSLKQIIVNGVLAFTSGNTFTALNVPLATGANTVVATTEDIAGNTKTATINITGGATLVDPVQLAASTVGGFATLGVTFTPTASVPGTIQQVDYDFNGDGISDQSITSAPFLNTVSHNFAAGEYFPVVTMQTSVGKFSSLGGWNSTTADRLRINVQVAPVTGNIITVTDPVDLKVTANGHLYILSRSAATIYEYDATPALVRSKTAIGTTPTGLDVDANGNVYVALAGDHQVAKFNPAGGTFQLDPTFDTDGLMGSSGTGNGQFNTPYDVAVSPDGQEIAVSDSGNHRIQRFKTVDGSFLGVFGATGSGAGQFNTPKGLTYDGVGYLYTVDSGNNRVVLTTSSSTLGTSGSAGTALGEFQGAANLCVGARGIYVAETGNNRVQVFDPPKSVKGLPPTPFTSRLALSTEFSPNLAQPTAVATIADFLAEKIYIADTGNGRVLKVTLPETSVPGDAWTAMKTSLVSNSDIDGAAAQFSAAAGGSYREAFRSIGISKASDDINAAGTLTPVFIKGNTAQYYFNKTIGGQSVLFPVEFVKENGKWKISDF